MSKRDFFRSLWKLCPYPTKTSKVSDIGRPGPQFLMCGLGRSARQPAWRLALQLSWQKSEGKPFPVTALTQTATQRQRETENGKRETEVKEQETEKTARGEREPRAGEELQQIRRLILSRAVARSRAVVAHALHPVVYVLFMPAA